MDKAIPAHVARLFVLAMLCAAVGVPIAVLVERSHGAIDRASLDVIASVLVRNSAIATLVAAIAVVASYPIARVVPVALVVAAALTSASVRGLGIVALQIAPGTIATILAMLATAIPLSALVLRLQLDTRPRAWLDAAADLGAGPWARLRWIEWPHLRPAVAIAFVWSMLQCLGDATITALAGGGKAYSAGLLTRDALLRDHLPARALLVVIALLVVAGILAMLVARELSLPRRGIGRSPATTPRLRAIGWAAWAIAILPGIGLLGYVRTPAMASSHAVLTELLPRTIGSASLVAILAAAIGVALAYALRTQRAIGVTTAILLPVALPPSIAGALALSGATVLGVAPGELLTIVALLPVAIALAFVIARLRLSAVPPVLAEAAADLGAGRWLRIVTVWAPATMHAAIAAVLFAFAWAFGEAEIAAFTSGPGGSTLATGLLVVARTGDVGAIGRWGSMLVVIPIAVGITIAVRSRAATRERKTA